MDRMDIDALWNFDDPAATETRFRLLEAEAQTQRARTHSLRRQFSEAHAILDLVEPLATPENARLRVRYLLERGRTHNSAKEKDLARPLFREAWELARSVGEDGLAVDAAHMLGIVEAGDESIFWNAEALKLSQSSSDPKARKWLGSLSNNLGWTYHDLGRFDDTLTCFQAALAARKEAGDIGAERIARWSVARCLRSLGRLDEALEIQQALRAEHETDATPDGYVFEELGECLLALGKTADARPHFARAYELLSADSYLAENEAERLARLKQLGVGE
jgi:tetratricopeptide (TPR) repeat protein